MKMMNLKTAALALSMAFIGVSCSNDDDNDTSNGTMLTNIQARADITTFAQALQITGLTTMLDGTADITVFAPTNAAMDEFLLSNGFATVSAVPVETLKEIVYNHFIQGSIETTELVTGYKKTFAHGSASASNNLDVFINTATGYKLNGISTVTVSNLPTDNGVLHIVDKVIGLPTIVTHVQANPELSTLATALAFNPASNFVATLSNNATQTTVFAPDNAAFTSFMTETGNTGLATFPVADLETTLLYHTATGNTLSTSFTDGQSITTGATQNVTINLTGGGKKITDINGRVSTITKADIQASNGVVHIIDKTLLPNF